MAFHYLARGVWLRWPRASHESLPRDPLRRLCSPLEKGHLLHQRQCQVHLPSWHKTRVTRSSHGRRTGMVLARCSFTCLTSSITSERTEMLYSNGCHSKASRMRRTSSGHNISLHPGQNQSLIKNFQSQNVQIFRYVHWNTNGPNHGPVWKTQSFLLNGLCTAILWQEHYGIGYGSTVGKKVQVGNVSL